MGRQSITRVGATAVATLFVGAGCVWAQGPSGAESQWTPPRTAWGDPDLQGSYTNTSEASTPLERPDEFAGRQLSDIQGEELRALKNKAERQTLERFQGPLHGADHIWQDGFKLEDGSQAWLIVDPPDGKIPPLTPEGKDRAATRAAAREGRGEADSWTDRSLYDRCLTRGLPGSMMPAIYGNSYQIVQAPGYVAIHYEMVHEGRVIPIDGGPHAPAHVRTYMGDARGHWEGDTLVVETTNFKDESAYRGANGTTLRLTERFTRISPDKVRWEVTVDDPETWTRPWTFTMPLTREAGDPPVLEYSCHEGNLGLRNILSAARAEEKAAEAKKKGKE